MTFWELDLFLSWGDWLPLYCDVLPVNTSNNMWVADFSISIYWILHQAEFTIAYNTSNYITWTSNFLRNCCDENLFQTPIADCSWWTPNLDLFWWTAITTCSSGLPWPDCFDNQSLAPYIVSVIHCCQLLVWGCEGSCIRGYIVRIRCLAMGISIQPSTQHVTILTDFYFLCCY
jgi:hypothetical protein